jgi:hypothetical protein
MKRRHRATLLAIFRHPASGNIKWRDVEALLREFGAEINNSLEGSRVGIVLNGKPALLHRPHPSPDLDKGAVAALRDFLSQCGITA